MVGDVPSHEWLGYFQGMNFRQRRFPFCGCGTAVHAAQKLNRQWIGIDITHLAISLIEKRLKDAFGAVAGRAGSPRPAANHPDATNSPDGAHGVTRPTNKLEYVVHGTPKDLDAARDLAKRDKYQFQWWAVSLVDAQLFQGKKKGVDGGIDGVKFFRDLPGNGRAGSPLPAASANPSDDAQKIARPTKDSAIHKIVVSVKGGENLKADDVRSIEMVRAREGADIAIFISLEAPTRGMIKDAASAGFYESPNGKKFPRVQLLTIEDLLTGQARAEHPDYEPDLNFKKAKQESNAAQKELI